MALRIHEVHPSIVHFPLTLLPTALLLDLFGRAGRGLMKAGRILMPAAAASAAVTGLAGLVAQESVRAEGRGHQLLVTHRNLNILLLAVSGALAVSRLRSTRPSWPYLVLGLAGVGAMNFTAYLGGKMVYSEGVGVVPSGGVRTSPPLQRGTYLRAIGTAARLIGRGVVNAVRELFRGELAPFLRIRRESRELREESRDSRLGSEVAPKPAQPSSRPAAYVHH